MRALILALLLAGCAAAPTAPKTFIEQVAYAEVTAQALMQTVGDLTCTKGHDAAGVCLEPGKPLKAALAVDLLTQLGNVRSALKASVRLPEQGGECLGQARTPQACLQAAQQLLLQVETYLANQGRP